MNPSPSLEWWRPEIGVQSGFVVESIAAAAEKTRDSAMSFWALMSFTFILLLAPQTFFPALASLRIGLLTAGVAVIAYLLDRFSRQRPVIIFTREMRIVLCLTVWAIFLVPFSYWPMGSISFLTDVYFKTLVIFWLLASTVSARTRLRQVFWTLSLMSIPLGVSGIENFLAGQYMEGATYPPRALGYESGLTKNPNDLALMLNMILPLSAALFLANRKPMVRALLLGIICLNIAAVIVTFSRAGFLTLAATFAAYLWKLRRRPERGWVWAALALALLCIPLLPSGYSGRLATITAIESDTTGSAQERWRDTLAAAAHLLKNPIIGAGIGMTTLAMNEERGATWRLVHNAYLEYGLDLGIPGLVLFLLLLAECLKSARFAQRLSAGAPVLRELLYSAEGIEVSLWAFAVAALFHPVSYHLYFYYFAGLAIAVKAIAEANHRSANLLQNQFRPQ